MTEENNDSLAINTFNNHAMEFRARIDTLIKSIFLISGGVLSITIGSFINGKLSAVSETALCSIVTAWYSLSLSIVLSLTTMFLLIIAQAQTASGWGAKTHVNSEGLKVVNNPAWFRIIMWLTGSVSFLCCVIGLAYIAHGAGQLITVIP